MSTSNPLKKKSQIVHLLLFIHLYINHVPSGQNENAVDFV